MKRKFKYIHFLFLLYFNLISSNTFAASQHSYDLARKIYFRITGTPLIDSTLRKKMGDSIERGQFEEAAHFATLQSGFINNTIRQFSASIHNRAQSARDNSLSESMLYFMLIAREDRSFDEVLSGKDFPILNPPSGENCNGFNNLMSCADSKNFDLSNKDVLSSSPSNRVIKDPNIPQSELSGVFTMQGFGSAAYEMGTNRRALQQTFNQLWCLSNENMKSSVSDISYIGRDVSRNSDGDQSSKGVFEKECRKCHSVIDGLRGAFAFLDSSDSSSLSYKNGTPVDKYKRGSEVYPNGFETKDDTWVVTFDRDPVLLSKLGWPTSIQGGRGVASFGLAVAQTDRFYRCMVEKVIDVVCPQDPSARDKGTNYILDPNTVVPSLASEFKSKKNIRQLFEKVVSRPECLGR